MDLAKGTSNFTHIPYLQMGWFNHQPEKCPAGIDVFIFPKTWRDFMKVGGITVEMFIVRL